MKLDFVCDSHTDTTYRPLSRLIDYVSDDDFWCKYLNDNAVFPPIRVAIHLGIFVEPFLRYVLNGTKTIESRFSINRCPPFGVVREGDVLLLKETGGPVVGISRIRRVWSYDAEHCDLAQLRADFGKAMCADGDDFWQNRLNATCVTLMQLDETRRLSELKISKHDRRGWVVLRERSQQLLLWSE